MKYTVYFTDEGNEPSFGKPENEPDFIAYKVEAFDAIAASKKALGKLRASDIKYKECYYPCRVDLDEL